MIQHLIKYIEIKGKNVYMTSWAIFWTDMYVCMQVTSLSGEGDTSKSSARGMSLSSSNFSNNYYFFRELYK